MSEFEAKAWIEWVGGRPKSVQKAIEQCPPGTYKLKLDDNEESAVEYIVIGYTEQEDGSVTAILRTEGLMGMFPRDVFGVKLTDLIPVAKEQDEQDT